MSHAALRARHALALLALTAAMGAQAQTKTPQTPQTPQVPATTPGAGTATEGAAAGGGTQATIDSAFKRADINGDGKLAANEMSVFPSLSARFGDLDKNKDGFVSSEEFTTGVSVKSN